MKRIFNFSPGPAILPEPVLKKAQDSLLNFQNSGMGILEISHRSKLFESVIQSTEDNLRKLLNIRQNYKVLFLQGGATTQFSMVPLNLMTNSKKADYINTGSWSKKSIKEAKRVGSVNVIATTEEENFYRLPKPDEIKPTSDADYLHYTTNNTIFGTQWKNLPVDNHKALVADASSDILSKPLDVQKHGIIYAGAQKNAGPAGVTIVIIRDDLIGNAPDNTPIMLDYKTHAENNSLYNTPPAFAIYVVGLVGEWLLEEIGGLNKMKEINEKKAKILYDYIDESDFLKGTANKDDRSLMNITFRLPNEYLEAKLIKEASQAGFDGLKGHRSVGGIRASIYNAFPTKGVEKLVDFIKDFEKKNK
jgi:phosphoserine aminotransferase